MKHELDRRVARELHVSKAIVTRITAEFLRQVVLMLVEEGFVVLNGLGALSTSTVNANRTVTLTRGLFKKGKRNGTRKVAVGSYTRVHFSKSKKLKELLNKR